MQVVLLLTFLKPELLLFTRKTFWQRSTHWVEECGSFLLQRVLLSAAAGDLEETSPTRIEGKLKRKI